MKSTLRISWQRRERQRGTQIVEFAVIFPLMLFLGIAIIEGGSFIRIHQIINNAAREGARVASLSEQKQFLAAGLDRNAIAETVACRYLNDNKGAFPGWAGDPSCASPFSVTVEIVPEGDPDAIVLDGVSLPTVRAIVTYQYQIKYMPALAFLRYDQPTLNLEGKAQFRRFY